MLGRASDVKSSIQHIKKENSIPDQSVPWLTRTASSAVGKQGASGSCVTVDQR